MPTGFLLVHATVTSQAVSLSLWLRMLWIRIATNVYTEALRGAFGRSRKAKPEVSAVLLSHSRIDPRSIRQP